MLKKIKKILKEHRIAIIWSSIALYIAVLSLVSIWKYINLQYNGIDLAILNQVFWNTSHGNLFAMSTHPRGYLGDHFTPLLLPLSLIYSLIRSPQTLLIMQSTALGLAAWPLYIIAKDRINWRWGIAFVGAWLLNPTVWNANLFEFHLVAFLPVLFFWVFIYYQRNEFVKFAWLLPLVLMVREDVSLIAIGLGILAWINKRDKRFIIFPIILGIIWFLGSMQIIGAHTPTGMSKFIFYYSWLGDSVSDILLNVFKHPIVFLRHLFRPSVFAMITGLLLPLCFLPILRPKFLIPIIGPFLGLALIPSGISNVILLHYGLMLLPLIFIAAVYAAWRNFEMPPTGKQNFVNKVWKKHRTLTISALTLAVIYSFITLGPPVGIIKNIITSPDERNGAIRHILKQIPVNAPVAAPSDLLPYLSSRQKLYSMHNVYIGQQQFAFDKYELPIEAEYLLLDTKEIINYRFEQMKHPAYAKYFPGSDERLRNLLEERGFSLIDQIDGLLLLQAQGRPGPQGFVRVNELAPNATEELLTTDNRHIPTNIQTVMNSTFELIGLENMSPKRIESPDGYIRSEIDFTLHWQRLKETNEEQNTYKFATGEPADYQLSFMLRDSDNNIVHQEYYPPASGLYPTSNWQLGEIITTEHSYLLPEALRGKKLDVLVQLVRLEGILNVNSIRGIDRFIETEEELAIPAVLGEIQIP